MTTSRSSSSLPPFIERGGEQIHRGPYQQDATDLRAFFIRGDRRRLTALCERSFAAPSGGAIRCRPLSDLIVLSFAQIGRLGSRDPAHRERGWVTEIDVAFWIPVLVDIIQGGAAQRSLAWVIPYIFVDQSCAMITGREVYGFPKAQGRFEIPATPPSDEPYRVFAPVLETFAPTTPLVEHEILELRRRAAPTTAPTPITLREALELALGDAPLATLGAGLGGLPGLLRGEVPVLLLRQLRDLADPSRAAFQEILLAPARTTALRSSAPIVGEFELELFDTASYPIARDLGLAPVTPIRAAFHLDFDFTMERGRTLFMAGSGSGPRTPAPPQTPAPRRQRLAVLGGGLGSLTAVFEITEQPGWEERFEITVYQLGHRLGGKGASGRNRDAGQRIEEHGLHLWFGFYENAFAMIRRCYAAAQRPPGAPLADWREAFEAHHHVVLEELIGGAWAPWTMVFPPAAGEPGDGAPTGGLGAWVQRLAAATLTLLELALAVSRAEPDHRRRGAPALIEHAAVSALLGAVRVLKALSVAALEELDLRELLDHGLLTRAREQLLPRLERVVEGNEGLRRPWIVLDLQLTMLVGIAHDRLLSRGFAAIDDLDFIAWLRRHGASELTVQSALVRVVYDLVFAYEGGDVTRPRLAAGVAVHGLLRMIFAYKGAVMWKMQAGMGDAIFAPLYEVLRARGVAFEFFHRVRELGLGEQARVTTISLGRQATIKSGGAYEPLVSVKGLPCWPDRPDLNQLVEAQALAAGAIDLESAWAPWADVEARVLREGEDFDAVILGIPPAALRSITSELCERLPPWRAMIDEVATVCTHAFQLWTSPDLAGLGWRSGGETSQGPVVGAYVEPSGTYADMSHLLAVEAWPPAQTPGHLAYFCGPLAEPEPAPLSDHGFPARARERVIGMAAHFLDHHAGQLWPRAVDLEGRFERALLVDVHGANGRERLRGQFFRANVEPSDRYTQSLPGTIGSRLRADGSGVDNLFLAGDWIDNGFNAGCVEAAVMSGMLCARAVTGAAISIADLPASVGPQPAPSPASTEAARPSLAGRLRARFGQ